MTRATWWAVVLGLGLSLATPAVSHAGAPAGKAKSAKKVVVKKKKTPGTGNPHAFEDVTKTPKPAPKAP